MVRAASLIAAVRDAGHDVFVVAAGEAGNARAAVSLYRSVIRNALPRRASLALRDLGRAASARTHARRVAEAALAHRCDVIIETQVHLTDSGAAAAGQCRIPLVLDDCSPPDEERALGAGLPALARGLFARQVRAAAALTVSSLSLRDRLTQAGVIRDKITIVSNGVDVSSFRSEERTAAKARYALGNEPVLCFAGSFQPWHRVELLIEALALVEHVPAPTLLLAGSGPELSACLALARHRGIESRVQSLGPIHPSRIPSVLAASDIGVLPGSNDYGQPMKLLEYGAARLAIVAPDLPPVRAMISHGISGLLFEPGDAAALAHVIARLLRDHALRVRLGQAAADRAADSDWSAQGRALVRILERVA
jgi:glycosyltransferase involved in cell wall biosynthesis